ncbi:hypothetical protein CQW23_03955 [Capsicum baccatum]|uniref:WRC domain-containing protein n=1 Tax=Capsicum baccatum TaxID=33114 RepID=A0A2G2XDE7_CAPBA|nr:hypothetical protein CQW23_03955 [Capsicum baccatum]
MRIRKHAKISPPLYTCSVFPGAHLCQLNQSPWDVITFHDDNNQEDNINQQTLLPPPAPPSSYQGSSMNLNPTISLVYLAFYLRFVSLFIPIFHCTAFILSRNELLFVSDFICCCWMDMIPVRITSLKLDDNGETKRLNFLDNKVADVPADSNDFEKDEKMGDGDNSVTTMCVKNDGKEWQCSREAKRGHNLCEHHFAQGKKHCSSNNSAQYSTTAVVAAGGNSNTEIKQTAVAAAEITPSSRDRPHRTKKSSSSEYYYYSGFGPLWGKKRGPSTGKKNNTAPPLAGAAEIYSSHDSTTQGGQSSSPQMDNEGAEHVEDEDDDAEEVENCKLIKRARKPIKARSLKSLM